MNNRIRVLLVAFCAALGCGVVFADDSVSSAFTFDARYAASGLSPADWEAHETVAEFGTFLTETVVRIRDENGNGIADEWEQRYGLSGVRAEAHADPDCDGRSNLEEYNAGTNPVVAENYLASVAASDVWTADTWIESTAGGAWMPIEVWGMSLRFLTDTAGRAPDADGDGIPDWWEKQYGLNASVADANSDSDGDGRSNLEEYNAGTHPMVAEIWMQSISETDDPFVTDTRVKTIGGPIDFDEAFVVVKTSAGFVCDTGGLYYDWDGDGMPNWWEERYSRDGSKVSLAADIDDDGDGMNNYSEFVAYTIPTDPLSKFTISMGPIEVVRPKRMLMAVAPLTASAPRDSVALKWQTVKGRVYEVWTTEDLSAGWSLSPMAVVQGTGESVACEIDMTTSNRKFYKVTVRLADDY